MKGTCDDDDRASGRPGEDRGDAAPRGRDPAAPWAEEATPLTAPATSRPGDGRLQAGSLNRRSAWRLPRPRALAIITPRRGTARSASSPDKPRASKWTGSTPRRNPTYIRSGPSRRSRLSPGLSRLKLVWRGGCVRPRPQPRRVHRLLEARTTPLRHVGRSASVPLLPPTSVSRERPVACDDLVRMTTAQLCEPRARSWREFRRRGPYACLLGQP